MAATLQAVKSQYKPASLRKGNHGLRVLSKETLAVKRETAAFNEEVNLREQIRWAGKTVTDAGDVASVMEFIGTGDFASAWFERQRFNIDVGRDQEPTLYEPLYQIERSPDLPKLIDIYSLGPAGVIFDEIKEGGEVKFVTLSESNKTARVRHYGVGVEYSKDMEIFNELWRLATIERQVGIAHNALLNDIHLSPFIDASYGAANQTAASSDGDTLEEHTARTLESALSHAKAAKRRGPYYVLCASANQYLLERVLMPVPQQGFSLQSTALGEIRGLIVYDGWSGTRGAKTVAYSGVSAGTCYLINVGYADQDHLGFVKQDLQVEVGDADVSRFMRAQNVWDTYLGAYCSPAASTEEVTLPSS